MKKSIIGGMSLLAGAFVAHGQGAVSLGNYGDLTPYIYVAFKATPSSTAIDLGGNGTGAPAPTLSNYALETGNGADWTVALYGTLGSSQPTGSLSLIPGMSTTFETGTGTDSTAGTWFSEINGSFSSAPNGTIATVQLFAWYNDGGTITSYATAMADGVPAGYSAPGNVSLGAPPGPPASIPALGNFNVTTTPEPSTIALGVIGASTFLLRLRRKQ
jgi:hypothetical protein